jgi:hypothetical protein
VDQGFLFFVSKSSHEGHHFAILLFVLLELFVFCEGRQVQHANEVFEIRRIGINFSKEFRAEVVFVLELSDFCLGVFLEA